MFIVKSMDYVKFFSENGLSMMISVGLMGLLARFAIKYGDKFCDLIFTQMTLWLEGFFKDFKSLSISAQTFTPALQKVGDILERLTNQTVGIDQRITNLEQKVDLSIALSNSLVSKISSLETLLGAKVKPVPNLESM